MNKEKIKNELYYVWALYKFPVIGAVVFLLVLLSFLVAGLTRKENVLEVMLIDSYAACSDEEMAEEFLQSGLVDPKKWDNSVIGSLMFSETESGTYAMNSLSRFMADIGAKKLDVCAMQEEDFRKYDDSGSFMDLAGCLTEEELQRFEGHLLITEDGRIIGIYTEALPRLARWGCYTGEGHRGAIGIAYNTRHLDEAKRYLVEFLSI